MPLCSHLGRAVMPTESEQAVMEEPEADAPAPSSWTQQVM